VHSNHMVVQRIRQSVLSELLLVVVIGRIAYIVQMYPAKDG